MDALFYWLGGGLIAALGWAIGYVTGYSARDRKYK